MEQMLKGSGFLMLVSFVDEVLGQGAKGDILAQLSEEARLFYGSSMEVGAWHPLRLFDEMERAILNGYFKGQVSYARKIGRYTMERAARDMYRLAFISFKKPRDALDNINRLWELYNRPGRVVMATGKKPCTAKGTLEDTFEISDLHMEHLAGWAEAMMEHCGAQGVSVEWAREKGKPVFKFTWEEE